MLKMKVDVHTGLNAKFLFCFASSVYAQINVYVCLGDSCLCEWVVVCVGHEGSFPYGN